MILLISKIKPYMPSRTVISEIMIIRNSASSYSEGVIWMFSISPRNDPAGSFRSATVTFHQFPSLPAPLVTILRRYLYVVLLSVLCCRKMHMSNHMHLFFQIVFV